MIRQKRYQRNEYFDKISSYLQLLSISFAFDHQFNCLSISCIKLMRIVWYGIFRWKIKLFISSDFTVDYSIEITVRIRKRSMCKCRQFESVMNTIIQYVREPYKCVHQISSQSQRNSSVSSVQRSLFVDSGHISHSNRYSFNVSLFSLALEYSFECDLVLPGNYNLVEVRKKINSIQ